MKSVTKPADIARDAEKYLKTHFRSICFYLVLLFLFFELSRYSYTKADDLVFQNAISRYGSFKNWVIFFGTHWGGRIIPQGILVLLLQTKEKLFHVFEALIWLILLRYVSKNYDPDGHINRKIAILLMACVTLCLIPMSVLSYAIFWKCANVLYLWGTSLTMAALYREYFRPIYHYRKRRAPAFPRLLPAALLHLLRRCSEYTHE